MNKESNELIECPFCKEETVFASVLTIYDFVSLHRVKKSGIESEGESAGELPGEMQHGPIIRICNFRCSSCGEKWLSNNFKLVRGDNGEFSFVKQEEKPNRKGRKAND